MKIRSHRVAQAAYEVVKAREQTAVAEKYGALALALPSLILQNGLAQATGFLLAKGNEEHLALLDDLAQVLQRSGQGGCENGQTLHRLVIDADVAQTMHLTRRSLDTTGWIKRYVQGILKADSAD